MNLKRPQRRRFGVELTALIDVLFILVIFLVLGARFERLRGLQVDLPTATDARTIDEAWLVVSIAEDGALAVDGEPVAKRDLERVLHQRRRRKAHPLVVMADARCDLQAAVHVVDSARRVGFDAVSVATSEARP